MSDDLRERIRAQYGDGIPVAGSYRSTPATRAASAAPAVAELPEIGWPVRLTLPWSHLVSDNRKYGVIEGRMLVTSDYRRAKGLIRDRARDVLGKVMPASIPLTLVARVWVPDDTRAHDVPNFAKCVHDALEGLVYTKDRWLHRTAWERAGVDVDAPRAELVIAPFLPRP